uniref:Uncharacterized protein n=1 Tax=Ditylenchus dipsaci TaxID=166011 RepID=A0A915CRT0_9BILA
MSSESEEEVDVFGDSSDESNGVSMEGDRKEAIQRCCFFHFSYSLSKNLKSLGLLKKCNREAPFQAYIREFRILPLLPMRDVSLAFENLSDLTLRHRSQFQDVLDSQIFCVT